MDTYNINYDLRKKLLDFKSRTKAHKVKITDKDRMLDLFNVAYENLKKCNSENISQGDFNAYMKILDERESLGTRITNIKPNINSLKELKTKVDKEPYIAIYSFLFPLGIVAATFLSQLIFCATNRNYRGYIEIRPYIWANNIGLSANTIKKYIKMCEDLEILTPAIAYHYYNDEKEICTIRDYVLNIERLFDIIKTLISAKQTFSKYYNNAILDILRKSNLPEDKRQLEEIFKKKAIQKERKEYIQKACEFYNKNHRVSYESLKDEIDIRENEIARLKAEIEALKAKQAKPNIESKPNIPALSVTPVVTPKVENVEIDIPQVKDDKVVKMEANSVESKGLQKGKQASIFDFM